MKKIFFLIVICTFVASCKNIEVEKYPNGNIKAEFPKDNKNNYHGEAKYYYEDGDIEKVLFYNHGHIDSCIAYYKTGELFWKSPYNNNKKHGKYREFYKKGTVKKEAIYNQGVMESYKKYDSLQNLTYEFKKLNKDELPPFKPEYVKVQDIDTENFSKLSFDIPGVPPSQITPVALGGVVQVKDRLKGTWEVKARTTDSLKIGVKITINDTTEILYGLTSHRVYK